jgi:hypothetical protein
VAWFERSSNHLKIERTTRRSAEFMRIADSVGTVERGKVADHYTKRLGDSRLSIKEWKSGFLRTHRREH